MPEQSILQTQLAGFATHTVATASGTVAWREAGAQTAAAMVLLHGIGSASGSWLQQLRAAQNASLPCRLLAWDAPGYGASQALAMAQPGAQDYAQRLWAWLDALGLQKIHLVGHSLGALMAAAAAQLQAGRVRSLCLLAPAPGYGRADAALRQSKLQGRLQALAALGPQGMAHQRGAAMLSPQASAEQLAYVQSTMAQIDPAGYTQAAHMLVDADLASSLAGLQCPLVVASGSADSITSQEACQGLAKAFGAPYVGLGAVGHACALEGAVAVNQLLHEQVRAQKPPDVQVRVRANHIQVHP